MGEERPRGAKDVMVHGSKSIVRNVDRNITGQYCIVENEQRNSTARDAPIIIFMANMHLVSSASPLSTYPGGIWRIHYLHGRVNLDEMMMSNMVWLYCMVVHGFL